MKDAAEWQDISTAPMDGTHIRLYRPEIQVVGYYAEGVETFIINAPGLPIMSPRPTKWKQLDWPEQD